MQRRRCCSISFRSIKRKVVWAAFHTRFDVLTSTGLHSVVEDQESSSFEFSLREIHVMNSSNTTSGARRFRHTVLQERVQLALELLTWAIIVWDTPWTDNMCVCSTQQSTTRDGKVVSRIVPQLPGTQQRCSLCHIFDTDCYVAVAVEGHPPYQ